MSKLTQAPERMPLMAQLANNQGKRAIYWLMFLGPFFFLTYGYANWLASGSSDVSQLAFEWEKHIPFIPWTIIPYWSIDLLYVTSLFICTSSREMDTHARRLLTAQIIAVSCFILFPMGFSFTRPETTGITGWLFTVLSSFDQPFNQAPSLHIALLVILWSVYSRHLPKRLMLPFNLLCLMITVSVLTTYQHHFIDLPTGALLGWLCVWLWPFEDNSIFSNIKKNRSLRGKRIGHYYLVAALFIATIAFNMGSTGLWLLWPAISLLLVALNYLWIGSAGFQKSGNGNLSIAARWLYLPYLLAAKINARLWTARSSAAVEIAENVYLGRFPSASDIIRNQYDCVIDLTAEFNKPHTNVEWHSLPNLDLLTPSTTDLLKAARLVSQQSEKGRVLITCALGYSRSAVTAMAWLLRSHRVETVEQAIASLRVHRPEIVIRESDRAALSGLLWKDLA